MLNRVPVEWRGYLPFLILYIVFPLGGAAIIVGCSTWTGIGEDILEDWHECHASEERCEEAGDSPLYQQVMPQRPGRPLLCQNTYVTF